MSEIYFIADIASNHDGSLERALNLVRLAAGCGADAVKIQNFTAEKIVSERGFSELSTMSHQKSWGKPVVQVYREMSVPHEWIPVIAEECQKQRVNFISTPYDLDVVDVLEPYTHMYKIGSGDITWHELLDKVASKKRRVILSTGASSMVEVLNAVNVIIRRHPHNLVLLQCNTNYTGYHGNSDYSNLKVLETYSRMFPFATIGLSDHTLNDTTAIAAVSLGAQVIEKHFTDDRNRAGPDHAFSISSQDWAMMVERCNAAKRALGDGVKRVEDNERETVIIQRRCIRAAREIPEGKVIDRDDLAMLRPCPVHGLPPSDLDDVVDKRAACSIPAGAVILRSVLK